MKNSTIKFTALVLSLILTFATPLSVSAATVPEADLPNASHYITSYGGYIGPLGDGLIRVYFNVTGTQSWNKLGSTRIVVEESTDGTNWNTTVANFHYSSYSNMIGSGYTRYSSSVPYQGVEGRWYRAYITIWAGSSMTIGDSRSFWTTAVQAT